MREPLRQPAARGSLPGKAGARRSLTASTPPTKAITARAMLPIRPQPEGSQVCRAKAAEMGAAAGSAGLLLWSRISSPSLPPPLSHRETPGKQQPARTGYRAAGK